MTSLLAANLMFELLCVIAKGVQPRKVAQNRTDE